MRTKDFEDESQDQGSFQADARVVIILILVDSRGWSHIHALNGKSFAMLPYFRKAQKKVLVPQQ